MTTTTGMNEIELKHTIRIRLKAMQKIINHEVDRFLVTGDDPVEDAVILDGVIFEIEKMKCIDAETLLYDLLDINCNTAFEGFGEDPAGISLPDKVDRMRQELDNDSPDEYDPANGVKKLRFSGVQLTGSIVDPIPGLVRCNAAPGLGLMTTGE